MGYWDGKPGRNWNETEGGYQEPIGGGAEAGLRKIDQHFGGRGGAGEAADFIHSNREGTFGNSKAPGILGGGMYQPGALDPNASTMPNADFWRQMMLSGAAGAAGRAGPMIDTGPQGQVRNQQLLLNQMLMDQAQGIGPSVAQQQLQQGTDANIARSMAMMQSQRGAGGAGAMRAIGNQSAGAQQQMASDASMLRLQEQMAARGMLGQQLGSTRGQDLSLATQQAQLAQNQTAINDNLLKFYLAQGMSVDQAQQKANIDMQGLKVQQQQIEQKAYDSAREGNKNMVATVMKFFGGMAGG